MTAAGQLEGRLAEYRELRRGLEEAVLPLATSVDGRRFTFQAPLHGLELPPGGYVMLDGRLGQVLSVRLERFDGAEVAWDADASGARAAMRSRVSIRVAAGEGAVRTGDGAPFHDATVRAATPEEVAAWLAPGDDGRARLRVGALRLAPGVPFDLEAAGFDRHTFFCGQSGSGKSYALGVVLEQLLLETGLRVVILDPNSDFVGLRDVRNGVDADVAERWRAVAEGIDVRSGPALRARLADLSRDAQAAMLGLDPVADREEYADLTALVEEARPESLAEFMEAGRAGARPLALRLANLGVDRWPIWARGEAESALDALHGDARCLVLDLGSLGSREEQAMLSEAVLSRLWERRSERRPVLVVIDEAHNVCPREPGDAMIARAAEHAVRIAAEGRKFGLYLLVCTQRPQKVHENVISQCDNLVLMRMASAADLVYAGDVLSFAPGDLVAAAADFRLGEALVAGKLASHPALIRFGARVAREGGGDVEASWASARSQLT